MDNIIIQIFKIVAKLINKYMKIKNRKIKVLQKHINKVRGAGGYNETSCPVALALIDAGFKYPRVLEPEGNSRDDMDYLFIDNCIYNYPRSVKTFVKNFDNKFPVKPFTFILKKS